MCMCVQLECKLEMNKLLYDDIPIRVLAYISGVCIHSFNSVSADDTNTSREFVQH